MGSTTPKSSHSSPSTRTSSSITPPANTHLPTLDSSRPLINSRPQKPSIPIYPIHPLRVFCITTSATRNTLPLSQCPTHPSVAVPNTIISSPNLSNRRPDLSRVYRDVGATQESWQPPKRAAVGG